MNIHPVYNGGKTCEQNGCHALLLSYYSSASNSSLALKREIVLGQYRISLLSPVQTEIIEIKLPITRKVGGKGQFYKKGLAPLKSTQC